MSIEEEIFTRCSIETNKLSDYGFKKINDKYVIEKFILNDSFKIVVEVLNNERIKGKIYDLETNEEYTNFRINGEKGEFTSKVRSEFENFLFDIKKHCSKANYFNSKQANRITSLIINKYHNNPEFMWDKYPSDGIFRSENSDKWYGLIMSVKKAKLDVGDELVDILNVKLDPLEIKNLINKKGFYKAYHMNKDNWITLILDDTLKDEEIMKYVDESYNLINKSNEWLIPSNPAYYDMINCFNHSDTMIWKQPSNIKVNDIIYLYVGAPISAILYKCKVNKINIPYNYKDKNLNISKVMEIQLLNKYEKNKYTLAFLNKEGVKSIRGPRYLPINISKLINN